MCTFVGMYGSVCMYVCMYVYMLHRTLELLLLYSCNRICIAISRADGAFKPGSAIHLGGGNSK